MTRLLLHDELGDFVPRALRGREIACRAAPHETAKHLIESLGVPHTEVGALQCNGRPVRLDHRPILDGDRLDAFPARDRLAGETAPRFIADAHLGRLARMLRFAGHDTVWWAEGSDTALAARSRDEGRWVLTRDRALLMHRDVERGCFVREEAPLAQLAGLVARLGLDVMPEAAVPPRVRRCTVCNTPLEVVDKAVVAPRLPPRTREHFEAFWRCPGCDRLYWRGSHWQRMTETLRGLSPPAAAAASG